jgi:hypothetical protein
MQFHLSPGFDLTATHVILSLDSLLGGLAKDADRKRRSHKVLGAADSTEAC